MIDLRIEYKLNGEKHLLECNTIMDFLDAIESESITEGTDVKAVFWENKLMTYKCDSLHKLYKHCREMVS